MASLPLPALRRAAPPAAPCARAARRAARRAPHAPRASASHHADAHGAAAVKRAASPPSVELLEGYDATLAAICAEVDACVAGDAVTLRSYVLEGGASSRRVLSSLRAAAARGVSLRLGCDRSALSTLTRAWERTDTLADELDALAREFPHAVRTGTGSSSLAGAAARCAAAPDHSKWLLVHRAAPEACSAVFGGINIGGARGVAAPRRASVKDIVRFFAFATTVRLADCASLGARADRFQSWRDFAVRLRGSSATAALAAALAGEGSAHEPVQASCGADDASSALTFAVNVPTSFCPLAFALRAPLAGRFDVAAALRAFFDDASLGRVVVAAAYVDASGAALLERALARGADVTLVMPLAPNVYTHCNAAALCSLLRGRLRSPSPSSATRGRLTAVLHPDMVHAKAAVGFRADGTAVALLGSANLKQRSLTQFGELLMRADGGAFPERLAASLQRLAAEGTRVTVADAHASLREARAMGVPVRPFAYTEQRVHTLAAVAAAACAAPPLRHTAFMAALEEWMG
jgi:phosphatidylserine/phosphatidylglycerophosphate/cardiolipin synthase-like enzyme